MRTYFELELATERGIELLDSEFPNWAKKIDANTLDIQDFRACMLGQLYGYYHSGITALDIPIAEGEFYGLNGRTGPEYEDYFNECNLLTIMWREEIQTRQTF